MHQNIRKKRDFALPPSTNKPNNQRSKGSNTEEGKRANLCSQTKIRFWPQPILDKAVTHANPPQNGQSKPNGKVGDIIGEDIGGVGDANPTLPAFCKVNLVQSNAESAHYLQLRQRLYHGGVGADLGVAHHCANWMGVCFRERGEWRVVPEPEEVESVGELVLEVGVHWACHQDSYGFHWSFIHHWHEWSIGQLLTCWWFTRPMKSRRDCEPIPFMYNCSGINFFDKIFILVAGKNFEDKLIF